MVASASRARQQGEPSRSPAASPGSAPPGVRVSADATLVVPALAEAANPPAGDGTPGDLTTPTLAGAATEVLEAHEAAYKTWNYHH